MEILGKKNILAFIILLCGVLMFTGIFINTFINFKNFKESSIQGKILEIKNVRVGKVFRVTGMDDFLKLYISGENQELLKIGDSVNKPANAKKLDVYRNDILLGSFPIVY